MTRWKVQESLKLALGLLVSLSFATSAVAAESDSTGETKMKMEDTEKKTEDLDEEITNARMRAYSGSKSKYSMSVSAGYQGGHVGNILGRSRPNLEGGNPEDPALPYASTSVSGRYRMNANDSITVGAGFYTYVPFQGGDLSESEKEDGYETWNVTDPSIGFSRYFGEGDWQQSISTGISLGTSSGSQSVNKLAYVDAGYTALTTLKTMPLTLGTAFAVGRSIFDGSTKASATQWELGVYPFLEYAFNDMFSFRTVFGYFSWKNRVGFDSELDLEKKPSYQSVGIGIAASRDVYIYPNVQFLPDDFAGDQTNFAVSAQINAF